MSETLIIQVRPYPFVKGQRSKSVVIQDHSTEAAMTRIDLIYQSLEKNNEARILFHK